MDNLNLNKALNFSEDKSSVTPCSLILQNYVLPVYLYKIKHSLFTVMYSS